MIHIGTSGYHFADWSGSFYPPDLLKNQWLRYYSQHFSTVEINGTYYGLPSRESVVRWAKETPADFRFLVKVHADTTHQRTTAGRELTELLTVLEPLRAESKLHGLLTQFPASFRANEDSVQYIREIRPRYDKIPVFVEFRHVSWDSDRAVALCAELNLGWVAVDLPPIQSLMGARPALSGGNGYIRFHGRNAAAWYDPNAGDRYDWEYNESELRSWVQRIASMVSRAEETYLFFNNCHAGQAIKSAALMREILRQEQLEVM